jgi:alanine racemase
MTVPLHPTRAIILLGAFRENLELVRTLVGPRVKILAVVKAEAYGHGLIGISRAAHSAGVDYLGVARVPEGVQLRSEGIDTPALVFEAAPPEHIEPALHAGLDLTVTSLAGAEEIGGLAQRTRMRARIHVKVDTGMGRLGLPWESAAGQIARAASIPGIDLVGVYSHFSTAEDADPGYARGQLGRFLRVLESLAGLKIDVPLRHMAGSGGILAHPDSHLDMVRPGIMLYGYPPRKDMPLPFPLKPVLSLVTRVSFIKDVPVGTSISYGRRYTTDRPTMIATLPVGYGDGYSRLLTNRGDVLIRGRRFRIAGTVCMDHCMVDVGPGAAVHPGDPAVLIGRDGGETITAWDLAEAMGTIPYEVTSLIAWRVPRVFEE